MDECCKHEDRWSHTSETLAEIKTLVTATNGRLRALESWRIGIVASLATLGGMVVAMTAVLGPKLTAILTSLAALHAAGAIK